MTKMTHGRSQTSEYKIWICIKDRCNNQNHSGFHQWGGRGIAICDEWNRSFEAFLEHVGPRPSLDHSIDRINNDGNYEPGNVRWATRSEQMRNIRTNVNVTHNGQTKTIAEWAAITGISRKTLYQRAKYKWPPDELLSPVKRCFGSKHRCAKLDENAVREIRARNAAGETFAKLASELGVSEATTRSVCRGRWRHVV